MRTLLQHVAFGLRIPLSWATRPYTVSGQILFVTDQHSPGRVLLEKLVAAIYDADAASPWRDRRNDFIDNQDDDSIKAISPAEVYGNLCYFTITPGIDHLAKGQLHGYKKYIEKMVKTLKERGFQHVLDVEGAARTSITFRSTRK